MGFVEKYGDLSVVPTRYFLAKPKIGEEMHIFIEQGKLLLIKVRETACLAGPGLD